MLPNVPVWVLVSAVFPFMINSIWLFVARTWLLLVPAFTRHIVSLIWLSFPTLRFPLQELGQFPDVSMMFSAVKLRYLSRALVLLVIV